MEDYYTTIQAAEILDRTPTRIVQLIVENSLKAEKVGRDYLIKKEDLDDFELKKPTGRPKKEKTHESEIDQESSQRSIQ